MSVTRVDFLSIQNCHFLFEQWNYVVFFLLFSLLGFFSNQVDNEVCSCVYRIKLTGKQKQKYEEKNTKKYLWFSILYFLFLLSFIFINFIISPIIYISQNESITKVNDRSSCVRCENDLKNIYDKSQLYCNMHTQYSEAGSGSHFLSKSVVEIWMQKKIKQMNTFRLLLLFLLIFLQFQAEKHLWQLSHVIMQNV